MRLIHRIAECFLVDRAVEPVPATFAAYDEFVGRNGPTGSATKLRPRFATTGADPAPFADCSESDTSCKK